MPDKRCIGCGKPMPNHPSDHGWTVTQMSLKGYGQRWYRQCGCMAPFAYYELSEHLFNVGYDYPARFPVRREKAPDATAAP